MWHSSNNLSVQHIVSGGILFLSFLSIRPSIRLSISPCILNVISWKTLDGFSPTLHHWYILRQRMNEHSDFAVRRSKLKVTMVEWNMLKRWGNRPDSESGGIRLSLVIVDSHFINWGTTQGRLSLPTADVLSAIVKPIDVGPLSSCSRSSYSVVGLQVKIPNQQHLCTEGTRYM